MTSIVMRTRIVSFAITALVWGCCTVPAGKFKALADSASQLGQADQQAYNQTIQVETYWLVIAQTSGDLKPDSFNLESAFDPQSGEHPLGNKDLGARMEVNGTVLTVIAKYLTALSSFASQDFQADLDKTQPSSRGASRVSAALASREPKKPRRVPALSQLRSTPSVMPISSTSASPH